MLGQSAEKTVSGLSQIAPSQAVLIPPSYNLSSIMPDKVKRAIHASEAYRLFFIFEAYIREFIVETLSNDTFGTWWDKIPPNIQEEISKLEKTEEAKTWMAIGSRDKSALMTYPQLLAVIDFKWKDYFEEIVRDKALIQEARTISHLRNTICHMTDISDMEIDRIKQTMTDWFRMVAP